MTDKLLSSISGGGSVFLGESSPGQFAIAAGSSGDLLIITPPLGKKVRLLALAPRTSATTEPNIRVTRGSDIYITGGLSVEADTVGVGGFAVGTMTVSGSSANTHAIPHITTKNPNDTMTISITAGSTIGTIQGIYEFGE